METTKRKRTREEVRAVSPVMSIKSINYTNIKQIINPYMPLSEHFTLGEMLSSQKATEKGIPNTPRASAASSSTQR